MSVAPVAVTGAGCVTPVGLSAPATCAALRAGLARMELFEGWLEEQQPDLPFAAGRVPLEWFEGGPDEEWPGHTRWGLRHPQPRRLIVPGAERLVQLAVPAAEEAWDGRTDVASRRLGCYLALDEGDPAARLSEAVANRLAIRFDRVDEHRAGRAAGLSALPAAAADLRAGRVDIALVGGVDSRLRRDVIQEMLRQDTLRTDENPAGVVPGEAASFVVLERRQGERPILGWLAGAGTAEEPTVGTDEPNRGDGLTHALRRARSEAGGLSARPLILSDLNGDRYRALEWGLANPRALGDLVPADGGPGTAQMWHPADCIGDPGAAAGVLNVIWAVTAMGKGYARSSQALVWGASDLAMRAAVLLRAAGEI